MSITKVETFNVSKFSEAVREAREEALALVGTSKFIQTYRDAIRFVMNMDDCYDVDYVTVARTASDLAAELTTAAIRASGAGATHEQIDMIVSLCTAQNDFAEMGYSHFTAKQASALINRLSK